MSNVNLKCQSGAWFAIAKLTRQFPIQSNGQNAMWCWKCPRATIKSHTPTIGAACFLKKCARSPHDHGFKNLTCKFIRFSLCSHGKCFNLIFKPRLIQNKFNFSRKRTITASKPCSNLSRRIMTLRRGSTHSIDFLNDVTSLRLPSHKAISLPPIGLPDDAVGSQILGYKFCCCSYTSPHIIHTQPLSQLWIRPSIKIICGWRLFCMT